MRRTATGLIGLLLLAVTIGWTAIHPSHDREWAPEQRRLPRAEVHGDIVTLHNVRDFRWSEGTLERAQWDDRTYDLSAVESVWYVLTPFSRDRRGPAHAFVSSGFRDGRFLAISVEARREAGESYSLAGGLLKRFEIMYVVGDERDLIDLRIGRGDDVYVYPARAAPGQARALLTDMLNRINDIREAPEFYGTLFNNCTTNLLAHVNGIASRRIRYGPRILLPGYSDKLALDRGLIDTDLDIEGARSRFLVRPEHARYTDRSDWSRRIRSGP